MSPNFNYKSRTFSCFCWYFLNFVSALKILCLLLSLFRNAPPPPLLPPPSPLHHLSINALWNIHEIGINWDLSSRESFIWRSHFVSFWVSAQKLERLRKERQNQIKCKNVQWKDRNTSHSGNMFLLIRLIRGKRRLGVWWRGVCSLWKTSNMSFNSTSDRTVNYKRKLHLLKVI